jgi:hypothetical protein
MARYQYGLLIGVVIEQESTQCRWAMGCTPLHKMIYHIFVIK